MPLKITHHHTGEVSVGKGIREVYLSPDEQRQLLAGLAENFGMTIVSAEVASLLTRPQPAAARRVAHYLEGRRMHRHLDQEEIHGIWVNQEDEPRSLLASDLKALLDYIRGV